MVEATAQSTSSNQTATDKKVSVEDFEFYKNVGEGSFGQVYLALHKESNKFVAIK